MSSDSTPRTAAGRALLEHLPPDQLFYVAEGGKIAAILDHILAIEAEAASPAASGDALRLIDDLIEYANALLGADLSYTELDPAADDRAAAERWPLTDSRTYVESVIEAKTWRAELNEYRDRRAALATSPSLPEGDPGPIASELQISGAWPLPSKKKRWWWD
jgi:hypothetical protein